MTTEPQLDPEAPPLGARAGTVTTMPEPRVYAPQERPDIEVLIDGEWYEGELRAWLPDEDGGWRANVSYRTAPGQRYLSTVPAEHVRQVET